MRMEGELLRRNIKRIHNALGLEKEYLDNLTANWGNWDECYEYVQHNNESFGVENIALASFNSLKLEVIGVWDTDYQFLMGKKFDLLEQKEEPFPALLDAYVQKEFKNSPIKPPQNRTDFMQTDDGLMIVSLAVVTDTAVTKPPLGALIMGRTIHKQFLDHLKVATQTDLDIQDFSLSQDGPILKDQLDELLASNENFISKALDEYKIVAHSILRDNDGKPVGVITLKQNRNIYQLGKSTTHTLIIGIGVAGLLLMGLIYYLSNRLIMRRLVRLKDELEVITESQNFDSRVTETKDDEIGYVSNQINHMFQVINESRKYLEQRVQERTESLAKLNEDLVAEIHKRTKIENELIEHREHLIQLAHFDNLTGLPNRVLLNNTLSHALINCYDPNQKIALLFIDIDRFKYINDAKGHEAGDFVLKTLALRLKQLVTKNEMAARIGGDEFIIIIQNFMDKRYVDKFSQAVLDACALPIEHAGQIYYLSASIGISLYPDNGKTLEDLQKNADIAMYKSKTRAPGHYYYFENEMDFEATAALQLDEQLHRALENNEFSLYYQPKYDIQTGNLVGMEALIRWFSPILGFVSPDQFIPYAEKSGLIIPIGKWVLEEACRAKTEWKNMGFDNVKISINMSPVQFNRQDMVSILKEIINAYQVNPENLEIEITESAIMNDVALSTQKLQAMRDFGLHISIDDFGTGYTSLNHIKIFPVDYLKIDRSFITGIPQKQADMAIIQCIVDLSHKLGVKVVAEGIETSEQLEFLASIGCDIAQGYLFARPLDKEAMTYELQQHSGYFGTDILVA